MHLLFYHQYPHHQTDCNRQYYGSQKTEYEPADCESQYRPQCEMPPPHFYFHLLSPKYLNLATNDGVLEILLLADDLVIRLVVVDASLNHVVVLSRIPVNEPDCLESF